METFISYSWHVSAAAKTQHFLIEALSRDGSCQYRFVTYQRLRVFVRPTEVGVVGVRQTPHTKIARLLGRMVPYLKNK
jgi:hypothetical protein